MKTITCVLAILAAASTAAVAKDLKQDRKDSSAATVSATQMSDSEMDGLTAGINPDHGLGLDAACGAGQGTCLFPAELHNQASPRQNTVNPGFGLNTH
jgi:hypothetical protein